MPHIRSLPAPGLLAATLLGALCAPPANAAFAQIWSIGNEVYLCTLRATTTDHQVHVSKPEWFLVWSDWSFPVSIGALPSAQLDPGQTIPDSPRFASLKMRCAVRDRFDQNKDYVPGETTYSIELRRDDPFWRISDPLTGQTAQALPRDGGTVKFTLDRTDLWLQPLYLRKAFFKEGASSAKLDYGPLYANYKLVID